MAIDTLGYVQRLREAGVEQKLAEAHATAARDYIMAEIATKADITELKGQMERQTLLLTIRLGGLMVAGIGALALLLRLGP